METLKTNSIFTNTAETIDGDFFWEGLEDEIPDKVSSRGFLRGLIEHKPLTDAGKKSGYKLCRVSEYRNDQLVGRTVEDRLGRQSCSSEQSFHYSGSSMPCLAPSMGRQNGRPSRGYRLRWSSSRRYAPLVCEYYHGCSYAFFPGVPLVFETFSWNHGIFTGACLKSEV